MDFYEVEAKRLMGQYGIPVDKGILLSQQTSPVVIEFPCVVKAQFLSGKRGKAGGIKFAKDADEFKTCVEQVRGVEINGKHPADILVVPKLEIEQEHYLGIVLDRGQKSVVVIYTPFGGMDIETLAAQQPDKLSYLPVEEELTWQVWKKETEKFALPDAHTQAIYEIAKNLLAMFYALDATTLEINPLVYTKNKQFVAADAKLVIDDNALFRQTGLTMIPREKASQSNEIAQSAGFSFVELGQGGDIGVMAGGAGIGMATIDAIKYYGETAYNFLDLGGTTREKTYAAMDLLLHTPQVKGIIANVFGGVNNCLTMAEGIRDAIQKARAEGLDKPCVVKSRGFNQEEGWQIYEQLGLQQVKYGTTDDAVKKLIRIMKEQRGERA